MDGDLVRRVNIVFSSMRRIAAVASLVTAAGLVAYQALDRLGLISLTETVIASRPIWGGGPGRTPPGEGRR